uniref:Uncharacterized protein n=1 Tax=Anguilla anguilla TaxID=7936 RepID=A0A0E9TT58_ANGAN
MDKDWPHLVSGNLDASLQDREWNKSTIPPSNLQIQTPRQNPQFLTNI